MTSLMLLYPRIAMKAGAYPCEIPLDSLPFLQISDMGKNALPVTNNLTQHVVGVGGQSWKPN
jgi:hypothetical protein